MGQFNSTSNISLNGFCDEKFLPVKEYLEEMLRNGAEENLQLCVYVRGKCVVDLYGSTNPDSTYNAETLQAWYINTFSTGCLSIECTFYFQYGYDINCN